MGFAASDRLVFPTLDNTGVTVTYSGTALGGTLTVSSSAGSAQITMVGDYTGGSFSVKGGDAPYVIFTPNTAVASEQHANIFDFSATSAAHVAPQAGVMHVHGGHSGNEITLAHDVTEATHSHGFMLDHFVHGLFTHHAMPEALA